MALLNQTPQSTPSTISLGFWLGQGMQYTDATAISRRWRRLDECTAAGRGRGTTMSTGARLGGYEGIRGMGSEGKLRTQVQAESGHPVRQVATVDWLRISCYRKVSFAGTTSHTITRAGSAAPPLLPGYSTNKLTMSYPEGVVSYPADGVLLAGELPLELINNCIDAGVKSWLYLNELTDVHCPKALLSDLHQGVPFTCIPVAGPGLTPATVKTLLDYLDAAARPVMIQCSTVRSHSASPRKAKTPICIFPSHAPNPPPQPTPNPAQRPNTPDIVWNALPQCGESVNARIRPSSAARFDAQQVPMLICFPVCERCRARALASPSSSTRRKPSSSPPLARSKLRWGRRQMSPATSSNRIADHRIRVNWHPMTLRAVSAGPWWAAEMSPPLKFVARPALCDVVAAALAPPTTMVFRQLQDTSGRASLPYPEF